MMTTLSENIIVEEGKTNSFTNTSFDLFLKHEISAGYLLN